MQNSVRRRLFGIQLQPMSKLKAGLWLAVLRSVKPYMQMVNSYRVPVAVAQPTRG